MKAYGIPLLIGLLVSIAPAEELKSGQTIPPDLKSSAKILEASDKSFTVEFSNRNSHDVHVGVTIAGVQTKSGDRWEGLRTTAWCPDQSTMRDELPVVVKAGETKRLKLDAKPHEPWYAGHVIRVGIVCYLPPSMTAADKAGGLRVVCTEGYKTTKGSQ